jgi:hypothetical protein
MEKKTELSTATGSFLFKQTPHPTDVDEAYHTFNQSNCLNAIYWQKFFDMVEDVAFDSVVECGVGRGRSLITIASLETLYATLGKRRHRHIYGLDSFEGFPDPTPEDDSPRRPKKGEWNSSPSGKYRYSPEFLIEVLAKAGIDTSPDRLTLVKGYFDESLARIETGRIGILHLDGDLYRSVLDPITMLADKIVVNGIVVIDDYVLADADQKSEKFPGARKAIEKFLSTDDRFELLVSIRGTPYLKRTA